MKRKLWCLLVLILVGSVLVGQVLAIDPVDDLQHEIDELEKMKKMSEDATAPLEKEVKSLVSRINNAQARVKQIKVELQELATSIEEREESQDEQTDLLHEIVARAYKSSRQGSPLLSLLAPEQNQDALVSYYNYQTAQKKNHEQITSIAAEIKQLNEDKQTLQETQTKMVSLEQQLGEQVKFFQKEIDSAKSWQKELTGKIASLTAQQQAIINARSGTSTTSVGEVPMADDPKASIGWKDQAPGDSFAIFSFGAYTHRNGMSQYGAKARAEAGQSAEQILAAYYPNATLKKDYGTMGEIEVQGYGRMSFEDTYLQSIYEVPASWPLEVLKAQAVAARTYAIKYTGNGSRSICTTEACQVYKNGKKGGEWEKAVNETRGWVLVDGDGNPVSTQYASTHGGYSNTSGWDTDGGGSDNWTARAWEAKAGSPWFYKAWWRSGYSANGDTCGRDHPWLSQEEMSDIINAWLVRKDPGDADAGRIQPVTINSCHIGGSGGNPYSMAELREFADKNGGAVTHINSVTVSHGDNGQTAQVKFETNRGTITMSGSEFKQIFNLRAPGYLRIPQSSFASFNIEHKG
ncbi:hypothetical protein IJJ27_00685 [bacterium]|nr:hypothetical protein [bacterium]